MSVIVTLGNAANTATFSTVDTLISGSGADTISLTGTIANASINLAGGSDTLTLADSAMARPTPPPSVDLEPVDATLALAIAHPTSRPSSAAPAPTPSP